MPVIDLTSVFGCQSEIQDCSRGIAYLDHHFGAIVDELVDAELAYDLIEAKAAESARQSKSDTAAEINGRIALAIDSNPEWAKARDRVVLARKRKAKVDRWIKSLEKRQSAGQSALKGHEQIQRGGG